ncbi:small nuclear ribonucleoprotein B and B' [Apiospora arundinis]
MDSKAYRADHRLWAGYHIVREVPRVQKCQPNLSNEWLISCVFVCLTALRALRFDIEADEDWFQVVKTCVIWAQP